MKILRILLLISIFLSWSMLYADPNNPSDPKIGPGGPHMDQPPMMDIFDNPGLLKELKLTDDQVNKLDAIKVEAKKKMIKSGADLMVKRIDFEEALISEIIDYIKVNQLIQDIASIHKELLLTRLQAKIDAMKVLTGDQRKELKKLILLHKNDKDHPKPNDPKNEK